MAIYGYTKNYKLIKPQYDTDTWHDYEYDNLDTIDAVLSAIYASGNWKGFWATNTAYVVGDVVIDRDTDTMYKVMVDHTTSAGSFAAERTAHHDYYELWSPNNLAESWATKTDGKVSDTDYSSKAYAISSGLIDDGSAKEWAIGSGAIGNTNEYSAKKYATDAHNDYISMTTNANVVAIGSNINNVNAVGQSISNVNTVAGNVSSVNAVGNNISSVNTAASNMAAIQAAPTAATNAANSANNSHIWAEGTDAQVAALGGVHSSKVWAQQSTNANIALTNSPYTTNRILEIPQDIKLELNNGTLTLKAGSKVYVPNGPDVFDEYIVQSDIIVTDTMARTLVLFVNNSGSNIFYDIRDVYSGNTQPSIGQFAVWYDTANNIVKVTVDSGSSWVTGFSLPICIATSASTNGFTSIDQVFNGFGYIGSTVFALPGVKVQTPNGKNADGTYKSVIRTLDSVRTFDAGAWGTRNLNISFSGGVDSILFETLATDWFTYNKQFSSDTATVSYDEDTGIWWYSPDQSSWVKISINILGSCRVENGKITQFQVDTVDSIVNSNEFYQLRDKAVTTNTAQTISGVKTFNNVVTAELESINFIAKNPTMDVNETPQSRKYVGYDFRDKNNVRIGYIGISQGTDGTFQYEFQKIGNYANKMLGITPPAASVGTEIVTAAWVRKAFLFPGEIIIWSAPNPPAGYLVCNGAAISRITYAALFQVIGTTWGAGDGSTTFNLPNFTGAKIISGNAVPVYGSGKGLRLTANASNVGGYMFQHVFDSGAGEFDTSIYVTNYASNANVGTAQSGALLPNNVVLGVPPKTAGQFDSGLQADLSGSKNVVYCIRY